MPDPVPPARDTEATGALARFAAGLDCERIPARVRAFAKDLFLDALACALAGHRGEESPAVRRFAEQLGASRESTVIGGEPLSLAGATLMNGFLVTAVSMCDVYRPTATHLQPVIVPPLLAVGEREGAGGSEFLAALVAGFETAVRVAAGLDYGAFRRRGFHGPGTIGPFGAAAAVGRLRRLPKARMAAALGLAGSQAAGTFAAWGTPTVKFHQCRGALSGLMAALLAGEGFVATGCFLTEEDGGFYPAYSGAPPREDLAAALGEHWEMERIALRPWPAAAASQGVITALLALRERHGLGADRVERLRVRLSPASYEAYAHRRTWDGRWQASSSIHYTAAVALHDADASLAQFEPSRCEDPALRRYATERVELVPDPALAGVQAVVEAVTGGGAAFTERCMHPKGSPEHPLSRAEVEDKFRKAARGVLADAALDSVPAAVADLENLRSVRTLAAALRGR
ncbi:MAG: MmgE/PrpD family protein [Burkholderiales bacterium]|nr:MmgE/PrpD family protein [Burkholderiales bacterium]